MLEKICRECSRGSRTVEIRPSLSELTFNNIMRMVTGKRYFGVEEDDEEAAEFRELIKEVFSYGGVSNVADFFPVLRWFDFKGLEKKLAEISRKMDSSLQAMIDENRRNKEGNTMINHLLVLQESEAEFYTEEIIKCIILVSIVIIHSYINAPLTTISVLRGLTSMS